MTNVPHETTPKEEAEIFLMGYHEGLKGITLYRNDSRELQALCADEKAVKMVGEGTRKGQSFDLNGAVVRVGFTKEDGNDIGLNDDYVSTFHGRFEDTDQGWVYIDQESRNGSCIVLEDGSKQALEPEKPRLLTFGDVLEIGDTHLRLEARYESP
jgi:hypothetical protein